MYLFPVRHGTQTAIGPRVVCNEGYGRFILQEAVPKLGAKAGAPPKGRNEQVLRRVPKVDSVASRSSQSL